MIEVPVYNMAGEQTKTVSVAPDEFGGRVRPQLIKQVLVAYADHRGQRSARTRSRGMVEGSTRKLFRQKGTGNARMGTIRTVIRRGGGVAFAKTGLHHRAGLPKKMKRLARDSAILAKLQSNDVLIIEDFSFDAPKTKRFVSMLSAVGATSGCVVALSAADEHAFKSGRNIPKTEIRLFSELNAYDILRRRKLIFAGSAFDALRAEGTRSRKATTESGGD